jgi:hypothetical protein
VRFEARLTLRGAARRGAMGDEIDRALEEIDSVLQGVPRPGKRQAPAAVAAAAARAEAAPPLQYRPQQQQQQQQQQPQQQPQRIEQRASKGDQVQRGPTAAQAPAQPAAKALPARPASLEASDDEELDRALADIDSLVGDAALVPAPAPSPSGRVPTPPRGRCVPVLVGGVADAARSCRALRCTACDHKVVCLVDAEWTAAADYLFFRNNAPDLAKLSSRASPRRGAVAYACQCSWLSARALLALGVGGAAAAAAAGPNSSRLAELRWVCAGHAR